MRMNKDAAALIYQYPLKNSGFRYQFVLIEKGYMTAQEVGAYITNTSNPFLGSFAGLYSAIVARGGKIVGYIDIDKATYPNIGSAPDLNINFQLGRVPVTVLTSGVPDWFLLYDRASNVAYNVNGNSLFSMKGTITDLDGDGDLKINNPSMTLGQTYRALNFKVRHVI